MVTDCDVESGIRTLEGDRKRWKAEAARYDQEVNARIEEGMAASREATKGAIFSWTEVYQAMEAELMQEIGSWHRDIGVLRTVREAFPSDRTIEPLVDYHIRVAKAEIENLTLEVAHVRRTAAELC